MNLKRLKEISKGICYGIAILITVIYLGLAVLNGIAPEILNNVTTGLNAL